MSGLPTKAGVSSPRRVRFLPSGAGVAARSSKFFGQHSASILQLWLLKVCYHNWSPQSPILHISFMLYRRRWLEDERSVWAPKPPADALVLILALQSAVVHRRLCCVMFIQVSESGCCNRNTSGSLAIRFYLQGRTSSLTDCARARCAHFRVSSLPDMSGTSTWPECKRWRLESCSVLWWSRVLSWIRSVALGQSLSTFGWQAI